MQQFIDVENIKCGGCAHSIVSKLSALNGVESVQVDVENGRVSFSAEPLLKDQVKAVLLGLGYPEAGSVEGMKAVGAKAKSFVSCAIGKVSKE